MRLALGLGGHGSALAATLESAIDSVSSKQLKEYVEVLANDMFEGRKTGSRGGTAAGNYLSQQFRRSGLAGAGENHGYFQGFNGPSRNILGLWEGSDPQLRQQVVLSGGPLRSRWLWQFAHQLWALGLHSQWRGRQRQRRRRLAGSGQRDRAARAAPKRTIVFALWDGEEHGLLGSKHWIAHPTIATNRIVCAINMDMIGRLREERLTIYGTRTSTGLRRLISGQNGPSSCCSISTGKSNPTATITRSSSTRIRP